MRQDLKFHQQTNHRQVQVFGNFPPIIFFVQKIELLKRDRLEEIFMVIFMCNNSAFTDFTLRMFLAQDYLGNFFLSGLSRGGQLTTGRSFLEPYGRL